MGTTGCIGQEFPTRNPEAKILISWAQPLKTQLFQNQPLKRRSQAEPLLLFPLRFLLLVCCGLLLASEFLGQEVGGGAEFRFQFDGGRSFDYAAYSVAAAGDVDGDGICDIIIGTPGDDPGGLDLAGSATVFSGRTGAQIYNFQGMVFHGRFGHTVSGAGDVDADGFDDLVIGAPAFGTFNRGSIFVYSGFDGTLLHQFNSGSVDFEMGSEIAYVGDVDNDGYDDILAGVPKASPFYDEEGRAYVFSGATGSIIHQYEGYGFRYRLGELVSGAGDTDGDGHADFFIGTPSYWGSFSIVSLYSGATGGLIRNLGSQVSSAATAGDIDGDGVMDTVITEAKNNSVSVFSGATGALLNQFINQDIVGWSAAGAGDVDGDHIPDIIVGAPYTDHQGINDNTGSVVVYSTASNKRALQIKGKSVGDYFGWSISALPDIDGDQNSDMIVGAPRADSPGLTNSGSAYVLTEIGPFLTASADTVGASSGGIIELELDFPGSAAFLMHRVLISESGTGPTSFGVDIPLTMDHRVIQTFQGRYPFYSYIGLAGWLDWEGNAMASFFQPAGTIHGSMIGHSFWMAAIAMAPGQAPQFSSVSAKVLITP